MNSRPLNTDPLRSFKFNVIIPITMGGSPAPPSGGEARFGFMSMSGLGVSIEPLTYREGGDNLTTRKMPGQADFNPITLSRGMFPTDFDNWYWMTNLFTAMYGLGNNPVTSDTTAQDFRTAVYINILDHPNNTSTAPGSRGLVGATYPLQDSIVKVSIKLFSAWISTLAYSDLDAGGNAVAVEQMSLNYEGFDMHWGGTGYVDPATVNQW
jgi:phage tail-like protein